LTSPSDDITSSFNQPIEIRDGLGRKLTIRRINALDRLRLLKAAGPDLSQNDSWLNMAVLTLSLIAVNEIPRMMPTSERQIEAAILELGDPGLEAIADALNADEQADSLFEGPPEGNLSGTPN
jgi:hypothetical protein